MPMVCPQCNGSYAQHIECPTCAVRLQFVGTGGMPIEGETGWQQTPWGRMFIGLVLAQGLGHGLQLLINAGLQATGEGNTLWATFAGLIILHTLQGFSLLVGGAITGAGNARGLLFGSIVGLINGMIFLCLHRVPEASLSEFVLYGQPILHMIFGGLGGWIGTRIWRPLPTVRLVHFPDINPKTGVARQQSEWNPLVGPIAWIRVTAGIALALAGIVYSQWILNWIIDMSQGRLNINSHLQAQLVSWEISALATLLGAGFAGATTPNGLKQGLCVAIGTGAIIAGIHLNNPKIVLETSVFIVSCVSCLSLAGGWFGGQLFPPVYAQRRRSRILED